jgi:NlpC/P60 family putative phage cell wall peptidase
LSNNAIQRTAIVAEARKWIDTPYHHQAMVREHGVDCLGLIRGVYIGLYGNDPEIPPPYSPDWGESDERELMFAAAREHLIERPEKTWELGDVLLFRLKPTVAAKHCAIVSNDDMMIHAYSEIGVVETSIGSWWSRHVAGVFTFPGAF